MDYEVIIGMEVHAELATKSKMFCSCSAEAWQAEPNTHTCPVCTALPGSLPVANKRAVEYTIMAGLALNCEIAAETFWERKNYHYPDLPKGYQISQYQLPLSYDGWVEIEVAGETKRIGITRAHLEEDTGKSQHIRRGKRSYTLIDLNRAGVPLLEIVSEPDIRSGEEARQYLTKLRQLLRYIGISDADLEKGQMRCEANVSIRPVGSAEFGTKVEVKNLNSFKAVKMAIDYEIERQRKVLEAGGAVEQVTMGWDERRGRTVLQRTKEGSADYRYFPEPDLPPLDVARDWVDELRASLPELPDARRDRFMTQYELSRLDAANLTADQAIADYFEACAAAGDADTKMISNLITGELFRLLGETEGATIRECRILPEHLAALAQMVKKNTINLNTAKRVFATMFETGVAPEKIVKEKGLAQISNGDALAGVVDEVIAANPDEVQKYLDGKESVLQWLMGQVMRATRGKANPQMVQDLLREKLSAISD